MTDSLCRLVLLEILPAVFEHDLRAFGAALEELQAKVGSCFAPAQGGIYATPQAAAIVDELKQAWDLPASARAPGARPSTLSPISSEQRDRSRRSSGCAAGSASINRRSSGPGPPTRAPAHRHRLNEMSGSATRDRDRRRPGS